MVIVLPSGESCIRLVVTLICPFLFLLAVSSIVIEFPDTKERFFLLRHKACAKCQDCNKHGKQFQRHIILL